MSYQTTVAADSPYAYWPDASAAPWVDDIGALDIAITGATANVTGPLVSGDTKAFSFDGLDDKGSVALDLTDTSVVTVEFWLWWDSFSTGFDLAYEFTAEWFTTNGGLQMCPDMNDGTLSIAHRGNVGNNQKLYTRPSAGAWHHYAIVHDFSQAATDEITAYLDGVLWTPSSQPDTSNNTGSHASSTLNLMCRNGASLFGAGDMAHPAVYKQALSAGRVLAHYNAGLGIVDPPSLFVVQSGLRLA